MEKYFFIKVKNENVKILSKWQDTLENRRRLANPDFNIELYDGEVEEYENNYYVKGFAPVKTLDTLKQEKINEINQAYQNEVSIAKSNTPEDEITTWDIQRQEALAWFEDNTVPTPFCEILAQNRGIELSLLLNKVVEKSITYQTLVATSTGKRQGLEDKIKLATSENELLKIKW